MSRQTARATAQTQSGNIKRMAYGLLTGGVLIGGAIWAGQAQADNHVQTIVTHGYSTYGDLKYPADMTHLDYVNPDAPKGGEISTWARGTFDSMNAYATQRGTPGSLSTIGYERVLTGTDDEVSSQYCLLCTTMEYPETEDWVIFHIRDDVYFSDGVQMTAHDIVFSHKLLLDQGTPSYANYVDSIVDSAEALDDFTVKFTFAPDIPRKNLITQVGSTPAWSQTWYEETGARLDEARLESSPGTGAYVVDEVDVNRRITYRRNPDYWGENHPMMIGRNNFDQIRVEYFADTQAAFEAFKAGEFTFRQENSSLSWATAYDFPALDNGWVKRGELADGSLPTASGFVFNLRRETFQDARVREALGLMFNFTWTNNTLQYGLFQQRESFWHGSDLAATGIPEGRELELLQSVADMIDPSILTDTVTLPHESSERQLDRGNLRRALALMEEAGYVVGDDGMLRKDGQTLSVEFLETRQSFDRIINPYVDNLKRLGVDITYNRVDPSQYQARTQSNDFDMIFGGYRTGLEEGIGLSQRFGSEERDDVFNPAGFGHPAVDALILDMVAAQTHAEMAAAVRAIDRIMRAEHFVVPVWYLGKFWVAYFDMYRYPENLPRFGLGHLDYWWYDAEAADALRDAGAIR